jgi:hypothetical protein
MTTVKNNSAPVEPPPSPPPPPPPPRPEENKPDSTAQVYGPPAPTATSAPEPGAPDNRTPAQQSRDNHPVYELARLRGAPNDVSIKPGNEPANTTPVQAEFRQAPQQNWWDGPTRAITDFTNGLSRGNPAANSQGQLDLKNATDLQITAASTRSPAEKFGGDIRDSYNRLSSAMDQGLTATQNFGNNLADRDLFEGVDKNVVADPSNPAAYVESAKVIGNYAAKVFGEGADLLGGMGKSIGSVVNGIPQWASDANDLRTGKEEFNGSEAFAAFVSGVGKVAYGAGTGLFVDLPSRIIAPGSGHDAAANFIGGVQRNLDDGYRGELRNAGLNPDSKTYSTFNSATEVVGNIVSTFVGGKSSKPGGVVSQLDNPTGAIVRADPPGALVRPDPPGALVRADPPGALVRTSSGGPSGTGNVTPTQKLLTGTPDRPLLTGAPERPLLTGAPERPLLTGAPERPMLTGTPERPLLPAADGQPLPDLGSLPRNQPVTGVAPETTVPPTSTARPVEVEVVPPDTAPTRPTADLGQAEPLTIDVTPTASRRAYTEITPEQLNFPTRTARDGTTIVTESYSGPTAKLQRDAFRSQFEMRNGPKTEGMKPFIEIVDKSTGKVVAEVPNARLESPLDFGVNVVDRLTKPKGINAGAADSPIAQGFGRLHAAQQFVGRVTKLVNDFFNPTPPKGGAPNELPNKIARHNEASSAIDERARMTSPTHERTVPNSQLPENRKPPQSTQPPLNLGTPLPDLGSIPRGEPLDLRAPEPLELPNTSETNPPQQMRMPPPGFDPNQLPPTLRTEYNADPQAFIRKYFGN